MDGQDRVAFLQGLVSNDVALAERGQAVWAALLTPQGKWLADFFVFSDDERLLLDCERDQVPMLIQRLTRFRLRSKVTLRAADELHVHVAWDGQPSATTIMSPDPRLPTAGWRLISDGPLPTTAFETDWDRHRIALGLPEGSRDMEADKSILLEAGFDELGGISWTKGCYMGQELTARTKYRGLVKRRLVPVSVHGPLPVPGTPILRNGQDVGTMRSGRDQSGLALVRMDAVDDLLVCGDSTLTAAIPAWMRLTPNTG